MAKTVKNQSQTSPVAARLAAVYDDLSGQIEDLQKQIKILKKNILFAVDKQKLKKVKSFIDNKTL